MINVECGMLNEKLFLMNSVSIPQLLIYLLFRFIPQKASVCSVSPPFGGAVGGFLRGEGRCLERLYPIHEAQLNTVGVVILQSRLLTEVVFATHIS